MTRFFQILATLLMWLFTEVVMAACPAVLNHTLNTLEGDPIDLCQFAGKVVLAVNTASYCGNTPQYKGLQALHEKYAERGLVVVGFPANDFGYQEPDANEEIRDFCEVNYGVRFPMIEKTSVVRDSANPVFAELTRMTNDAPEWNFHKYLISRDGTRAFSYAARMLPDSPLITGRIEELLAE